MSIKTLTFQNVILCEFATLSERRKYTLVNVFAGKDVKVTSLPGQMGMGLYAEIVPSIDTPRELDVEIRYNDLPRAKIKFAMERMTPGVVAVLLAQIPSMPLPEPGTISFFVSADGFKPALLIEKRIVIDESNPVVIPPKAPAEDNSVESAPAAPRPTRPRTRRVK